MALPRTLCRLRNDRRRDYRSCPVLNLAASRMVWPKAAAPRFAAADAARNLPRSSDREFAVGGPVGEPTTTRFGSRPYKARNRRVINELWAASLVVLWIVVLILVFFVAGALRLIGLIQLRLGTEPGALITDSGAWTVEGRRRRLPGQTL